MLFKCYIMGYLGLFQEAQEPEFLGPQDQEGVASAVDASGRPAHPVDVLLWSKGMFSGEDIVVGRGISDSWEHLILAKRPSSESSPV